MLMGARSDENPEKVKSLCKECHTCSTEDGVHISLVSLACWPIDSTNEMCFENQAGLG